MLTKNVTPFSFTVVVGIFLILAASLTGSVVNYQPAAITYYSNIYFNANGGYGGMSALRALATTVVYLPPSSFTNGNLAFIGWSLSASGPMMYADGTYWPVGYSDTTLYAVWAKKYVVLFDSNGGIGNMPSQMVVSGKATNLIPNSFTKSGYDFDGWSTTPNGPIAVGGGAVYAPTADTKLYARWTASYSSNLATYTITFHANGGSGTMLPQTGTQGVSAALKSNTFTKAGYIFSGWSVSPNEGGLASFQDNAPIQWIHVTDLYAAWTPVTSGVSSTKSTTLSSSGHTIWFINTSGGSGYLAPYTSSTGTTLTHLPKAEGVFTRPGFVFAGWATSLSGLAAGNIDYLDGASYTIGTSDENLYAVWGHKISFSANGGMGTMTSQAMVPWKGARLNLNTFTWPNHAFYKWATTSAGLSGPGPFYSDGEMYVIGDSDVTLYATWDKTVNIQFFANGGSGSMPMMTVKIFDTVNLHAVSFYWPNTYYDFRCWTTSNATDAPCVYGDKALVGVSSDISLYAKWAPVFTVSFNPNSGTGAMAPQRMISGVPTNLTINYNASVLPTAPYISRSGFEFDGWSKTATGSRDFIDGGTYTIGTNGVTLYAHWVPKHLLNFDRNGGSGSMASMGIVEGKSVWIPTNKDASTGVDHFTKVGYIFKGWSKTAAASVVDYADGDKYTMGTADGTLYAKWVLLNKISFYANGAGVTGSMPVQLFDATKPPVKLTANAFVRPGYDFKGWATSAARANAGTVDYADRASLTMGASNVDLYAAWALPSLGISCFPSMPTTFVGAPITWIAYVFEGNGSYSYIWSSPDGDLSGYTNPLNKTYTTVGTKRAKVVVADTDGRTGNATCIPLPVLAR